MTGTALPTPRAHPLLRLLSHLPLPVFRAAGAAMGALLFAFGGSRRRIVWRNLELCFPDAGRFRRMAWTWQTFVHFGQSFVDRVWLWHGPQALIERRVQLTGEVDALRNDQPVLLFVPHFLGMDAAWTRLTLSIERRWWTFYAPQGIEAIDRWVREGRQRFGTPRLVSKEEGLRPLVKGLRDGAALCLLPDMDHGSRDSVFVPFFGVEAATVTSLPRLAKVAGVPVRPWISRLVRGGYRVEVLPEWQGYPSGDDAADTRFMNEQLEACVRTMPGQYYWLHRRFKTRPSGQADLYRR